MSLNVKKSLNFDWSFAIFRALNNMNLKHFKNVRRKE